MLIGEFDSPDERLAFADSVTIRAACDQQVKAIGQLQVVLRRAGRMFGVETFNSVQPGFYHCRNHLIGMVKPGMGHDGNPAGVLD